MELLAGEQDRSLAQRPLAVYSDSYGSIFQE
jgi:hypothetical protein